jgi:hypothetical protein
MLHLFNSQLAVIPSILLEGTPMSFISFLQAIAEIKMLAMIIAFMPLA